MVLDGLDEMAKEKQAEALERLSDAVLEKQCMVVTCRTEQYHSSFERTGPLAKTPVIELGPLPMSAVRAYLHEGRAPAGHWDELLDHLEQKPKGVPSPRPCPPAGCLADPDDLRHTTARRTKRAADRCAHHGSRQGSPGSETANKTSSRCSR